MAHQGSCGPDSHLRFPLLSVYNKRMQGLACGVGILHGSLFNLRWTGLFSVFSMSFSLLPLKFADVAELADALESGSSVFGRGGSSPSIRTICGSSSVVEHHLAKVGVAGSNPVFRSNMGP